MTTGKYREHEDFQVYDIDVFYNGNLIVAGFFSSVILSVISRVFFKVYLQMHGVLCYICCV